MARFSAGGRRRWRSVLGGGCGVTAGIALTLFLLTFSQVAVAPPAPNFNIETHGMVNPRSVFGIGAWPYAPDCTPLYVNYTATLPLNLTIGSVPVQTIMNNTAYASSHVYYVAPAPAFNAQLAVPISDPYHGITINLFNPSYTEYGNATIWFGFSATDC